MREGTGSLDATLEQAQLCEEIATACQLLAYTGVAEHVLGHISVRVDDAEVLVRCRGPHESGLAYTTSDDIRPISLNESRDLGAWRTPNELPIHTEIMRQRPDVTAVVHAHPPAVVSMSLVGAPWLPIFGSYDIPAARLAADGIPVWPRAALVTTVELARDLADCLGEYPLIVLRGHGVASVARGPAETALARAVLQVVAIDTLARMSLSVLHAGGSLEAISEQDLALLPDLGGGFNVDTMWRHLRRSMADQQVRNHQQARSL